MTFPASETGPASGRPRELFTFTGTNNVYRMTTFQEDVVSNGNTFTAVAGLRRERIAAGTQEQDNASLDIEIPFSHPIVSEYVWNIAPPALDLELHRVHAADLDDTLLMWKGQVISWAVEGRKVKLRVPSLFGYLLNRVVPRVKYQAPCNNFLYDDVCGVDPTSFTSTRTIVSIDENAIELDTSPFADDACNGGEMIFTSGSERRMIIDNVGVDFTVNFPFADLEVGDTVQIRQGCDHSWTTCKTKFNNGDNFVGFPFSPQFNPFTKSRL